MFGTVLCVAYACLSVSAATSWYKGCNITKLMTPSVLGIKPTFHLVNKKYGKVQRSVCPQNATADCLTFASHSQDAMSFIMDSYLGSIYFNIYEANDDGTIFKDQSGKSVMLGPKENYYYGGDAQFNRLDQNSNGELSLDEYGHASGALVSQNGNTFSYLLNTFIGYDNNSDGFVTRDEQKAYMKKYYDDSKDIFLNQTLGFIKDFDENNDSMLQSDELKLYFASSSRVLTKDSFAASFAKYDKNGDKGLDGNELYGLLTSFSDEKHHFISLRVLPPFDKASTLIY
uniref:EF-hand domain-containing protein n=1 Tax=Plectus sambesii TaxID=2011161 RepID=A0A914VQ93_9BILA